MNILALCGRKGSGKSHIAKLISQSKIRYNKGGIDITLLPGIRSFAEPLKDMLGVLPIDDIDERLYGHQKEDPEHLVLGGNSMRHAMATLGTEWGRKMIHEDIWVDCMKVGLLRELEDPRRLFIIDDLRFENEVALIKSFGGTILAVRSFEEQESSPEDHASETLNLDQFYGLHNNKDVAGNASLLTVLSRVTPWSFR